MAMIDDRPITTELVFRDSEEIQGNVLAPFNKDHRIIMFLKFPDADKARGWLQELIPRLARTKEVAEFNKKYSEARRTSGGDDPKSLKATWLNLSLTYDGLVMLSPALDNDLKDPQFRLNAFVQGPAARAGLLGDTDLSDPQRWVIGGPNQMKADAMLFIDADDLNDLRVEADKMRTLNTKYGLVIIFEQLGETLPKGEGAGHEHFGFKDGISQPGVRGFDEPDPSNEDQVKGHLGSDLLQPGEFVVGHPRQPADEKAPPDPPRPAPTWMKDGSFIVFRRLNQDVAGFWAQVTDHVHSLPSDDPMTEDLLAAKLVGRWRSGTPLDLSPDKDNSTGIDDGNNNFEFKEKDANGVETDERDQKGLRCPRFAHIRKVYPRDNDSFIDEQRRIMRRGIPFGLAFKPAAGRGFGVDAERGLLFAAYMSSIEDQFEFVQTRWVNDVDFPDSNNPPGPDPIIGVGQPNPAPNRLRRDGRPDLELDFKRFVNTTGAVYAFTPSISTLTMLAGGTDSGGNDGGSPEVETINGYAVGFAFLRFYKLHPEIGLPVDQQHENGYQSFEYANLEWNGQHVVVYWNNEGAPKPDWLDGADSKEFEV